MEPSHPAISPGFEPIPPDPLQFWNADLVVVLPTLNEEGGLPATIRSIPAERNAAVGRRIRILVVDGGSVDGTVASARALGVPVLRQHGKGKGRAVREALAWLRGAGVRYAAVMDADSTYPGEMIGALSALLHAGSHLVVGVRLPMRTRPKTASELVHRAGNAVLNYAAGQVSGRPILDLCSGFWGIDLRTGLDEGLESDGFEIEAELFLKAHRQGFHVNQFPIPYKDRIGEAKLRATQDGLGILARILRSTQFSQHSSVRDPPRPTPFLRELLSICFLRGHDDLVVVADSSRHGEAQALIAGLRRSEVHTQLHVGHVGTPPGSDDAAKIPEVVGPGGPAVVALKARKLGDDGTAPPFEVYLPSVDRVLYVQFGPDVSSSAVSRSGGFFQGVRSLPRRSRAVADAIRPLWVSLGGPVGDRDLTFLNANGLRASVVPSMAGEGSDPPTGAT